MNKIKEDFAKLIREWRLERNIGLRDFSKLINISPALLSRIENPNHEQKFKDLKKRC